MKQMRQRAIALSLALSCVAAPAWSDCGFCAREVTLSRKLASCYIDGLDNELARLPEGAEFHFIELAACGADRSGSPMPQPTFEGRQLNDADVDESFLIPVNAMVCLAVALSEAAFEGTEPVRFEISSDC